MAGIANKQLLPRGRVPGPAAALVTTYLGGDGHHGNETPNPEWGALKDVVCYGDRLGYAAVTNIPQILIQPRLILVH